MPGRRSRGQSNGCGPAYGAFTAIRTVQLHTVRWRPWWRCPRPQGTGRGTGAAPRRTDRWAAIAWVVRLGARTRRAWDSSRGNDIDEFSNRSTAQVLGGSMRVELTANYTSLGVDPMEFAKAEVGFAGVSSADHLPHCGVSASSRWRRWPAPGAGAAVAVLRHCARRWSSCRPG